MSSTPKPGPSKDQKAAAAGFTLASLVGEHMFQIAMVVLLWNRWVRHAFGVERKLRFREVWAAGGVIAFVGTQLRSGERVLDQRIERAKATAEQTLSS